MSKEEKDAQRFKVTDRRGFTAEGERREKSDQNAETPADAPPTEPPPDLGQKGAAASAARSAEKRGQAGQIDFSSFVISLATTALMHLGEVPDPSVGKPREDLDAAKQMVDILGILKEKSEGNRTAEEDRLLEEILYELRMKFLSKSKTIQL